MSPPAPPLEPDQGGRISARRAPSSRLRLRLPAFDWRGGIRWFSAEFLVVVSGVLVALALNAWWQGRNDAERERAYLRQLLVDFRANEQQIEDHIRRGDAVAASINKVYRAAHLPGPLPPGDSLRLWLNSGLYLPDFQPRTATYEALVQSGEIDLIRDDSLRNSLIEFAGLMDYVQGRRDHLAAAGFDGIRIVLRRVDAYEITGEQGRANRGWEDLESHFPPAWEELLADPEFVSVLITMSIAAGGSSFEVGRLREPTHDIIRLLEQALAR